MPQTFYETVHGLETLLSGVIRGKNEAIRLTLLGLLSGGHVLLEDSPGTGKTTLAKSLARLIDGRFRRIQFTPDLLPADITGSSFYNQRESVFEFREGPVFTNVLLADEINRTSPRTQSALLEVMGEYQATTDGQRRALPQPFFVIATQNPSEYHGTYPLPEAQLDRFTLRVTLGYPETKHEVEMLFSQNERHPFDDLKPAVTCAQVLDLQAQVRKVHVDRAVAEYMVLIVEATRHDPRLRVGISPRGSLALYRVAQARALLDNRDHVLPEDIKSLVLPVLCHRVVLDTKARYGGVLSQNVIQEALTKIPVPR